MQSMEKDVRNHHHCSQHAGLDMEYTVTRNPFRVQNLTEKYLMDNGTHAHIRPLLI